MQAQEQVILSNALFKHLQNKGVDLQKAWDDCWNCPDLENLKKVQYFFCDTLLNALHFDLALDDMKNMMIPAQRCDLTQCVFSISCFNFPCNLAHQQGFFRNIVEQLYSNCFDQEYKPTDSRDGRFQLPRFAIIFPSESLWSRAKNIFKTSLLPTLGRVVRSPDARFVAAVITLLVIDNLLAADDQTGVAPDENIAEGLAFASSEFDNEMCTDEDFCDPEKNKDFGDMFSAIMRPIADNVCGVSLDMKGVIQQLIDGVGGCNRFRLSEMMKIQREICHLLTIDNHAECRVPYKDYE